MRSSVQKTGGKSLPTKADGRCRKTGKPWNSLRRYWKRKTGEVETVIVRCIYAEQIQKCSQKVKEWETNAFEELHIKA